MRTPLPPWVACSVSLATVVLWVVWAAHFNSAQFGDNVEQFNWAQSLEFGYHKHPPLPSWLLASLIRLFGPSVLWAYLLATLCLLGTAFFSWLIGRRLLGERVAAAGVVLWGLSLNFSQRAQLYNHNTVLVLGIAVTVWLGMRASDSARRTAWKWWLATGIAAAASVLSKYQALVPLAGLLCALALSGALRLPAQRRGLCLATATLLLLCAPHMVWVARHDYSTLRYASEAVESSGLMQRLMFIASFWANQLRIGFPALAAIALCDGWARLARPPQEDHAPGPASPTVSIWMFGLLGAGLIVLVVMALAAGVSLRNHWGVQALQFSSWWIAYRWDRRKPIDLRVLVCAALLVHGVSLAAYAAEHSDPAAVLDARRIDTMYPAKRLAHAAVVHWTETTACPMHYVAGAVFDSGLVSLYSGGTLKVFETTAATPWVRADDLRREGALYVLESEDPVPPGVTRVIPFDVVPGDHSGRPARTIRIGVLMPEMRCGE